MGYKLGCMDENRLWGVFSVAWKKINSKYTTHMEAAILKKASYRMHKEKQVKRMTRGLYFATNF